MKRVMLFVALILAISAACRKYKTEPENNNQPLGVGAPGAGPGVMGVHGAVSREELEHALGQIRIYIDNASGVDGTMPSVQATYAALQREAPKYAKFIDNGNIVLNPAKSREEVWAYAVLPQGNYAVLTSSGIERKSQQELNSLLRR